MLNHFYLYHTTACHLCELAEAVLLPAVEALALNIELVDIAEEDDALIEQYGTRIPVLRHVQSSQELGWPFDEWDVKAFLEACFTEGESHD